MKCRGLYCSVAGEAYLRHWHPLWAPVEDLAALLPLQVPADVPGKAVKADPSPWTPESEDLKKNGFLASD